MNRFYRRILILVIIGAGIFLVNKYSLSTTNNTNNTVVDKKQVFCTRELTPQLIEGPYYKNSSPQITDIGEGAAGERLVVSGYVYDTKCQPIAGAWLDFWQADGNGVYDNAGYKLRGHQFTDKDGKYVLETVVPERYPGRTPHIHVKLRANDKSPIITTQLFMPSEAQNKADPIFNQQLIMNVKETEDGKVATFDFVLNLN